MSHLVSRLLLLLVLLPCLGSDTPLLEAGDRIKAKGTIGPDGEFVATSLRRKNADDDDLELCGVVEWVDPETRLFRVHGVWADAMRGDLNRRQRRVAQALLPGDWVALEGELEGSELLLDSLTRPRGEDRIASVEGIVSEADGSNALPREISIGPVIVVVTETTELKGF